MLVNASAPATGTTVQAARLATPHARARPERPAGGGSGSHILTKKAMARTQHAAFNGEGRGASRLQGNELPPFAWLRLLVVGQAKDTAMALPGMQKERPGSRSRGCSTPAPPFLASSGAPCQMPAGISAGRLKRPGWQESQALRLSAKRSRRDRRLRRTEMQNDVLPPAGTPRGRVPAWPSAGSP